MMLRNLLKEVGESCTNLRETYSDRMPEQVEEILKELLEELQDLITVYVKQQHYPKHIHEIYKPHIMTRLPEHIRQRIVVRVDSVLDADEILLKFDMYMVLCTTVGNIIQNEYATTFQKIRKRLLQAAGKDINPQNN